MTLIRGSGGGKGAEARIPVETPDNLASDDFATVLDLISEGEIEGLVNGLRSIYLDDVPLQNMDGSFNFEGVTVETRNGTAGQSAISLVEGSESETGVGVEVKAGTPIERSIVNSETDRVRVTIGVPQLTVQNESTGDINGSTIEYKISVSANGGAFVDANLGGGAWKSFTGTTTPVATQNLRASVKYTPNKVFEKVSATVQLQYRVAGSADPWTVAGEEVVGGNSALDVMGYVTSYFEVIGLPNAIYELRAFLVSATESPAGSVAIAYAASGTAYPTAKITGKTTSRYKRSHVINLRTFGSSPYIVRVTRITPDSTKSVLQNRTFWDSYTEIVDERLRYPHSALVAMRMGSKQFSAIPTRGYHIRGIKVKVPANYDPISRTYATTGPGTSGGSWDGTFKVAWTDNPAWVFFDLATSERYGTGQHIKPAMMDKWTLYQIAQYCDELVPNGYGGEEPRYTCNLYLQTREQAYSVLTNVASIFRGMLYWGAGAIMASADMPSDAVYQFNQSNVVDGLFNYAGSRFRSRHNVALVTWNDPQDRYRQKVEYVEDSDAITTMGFVNQTEVYAVGCTSQGQARRVGKWIIYTERFENETVSFRVGLDGNIPRPGDVIQIADPARAGERMGGRLIAGSTTTSINLDANVTILAGETYSLTVVNANGELETRAVTTGAGAVNTLTVGTAFSAAPVAGSLWVLSGSSLVPQLFRVIGVAEEDGGSQFSITALSHYPSKYAAIENDEPLSIPQTSKLVQLWTPPEAPTGLVLTEALYLTASRAIQSKLTVSWDSAPLGASVGAWEYIYRIGTENNWSKPERITAPTFDILGLNDGDPVYVRVFAINSKNVKSSSAAAGETVIAGKALPPSGVTGFTVTRAGNVLNFSWNHIDDVDRSHYEIRRGDSWTSGIPLGASVANAFTVDAPRGGTFLIKSFDLSANASVSAATVTVGDSTALSNAYSHDESAGGWNGTKSNCASYDLTSSAAWADLSTWSAMTTWDDGSPKTGVLEDAMATVPAVYTGETIDLGASKKVYVSLDVSIGALNALAVKWPDLINPWSTYTAPWKTYGGDASISYSDAIVSKVEYQTSADGTNWSQALPFVPGTYTARYFRFVVTMQSMDVALSAYLYRLNAYFDLLERQLHFKDVAISSGGTAVSFTPAFAEVRTVQVTPNGGATGDTYKVSAKSGSGVTINLYTSAGVAKAGVADIDVFGYGET